MRLLAVAVALFLIPAGVSSAEPSPHLAGLLGRSEGAETAELERLSAVVRSARAESSRPLSGVLDVIELRSREAATLFADGERARALAALDEAKLAERLLERRRVRLSEQTRVRDLERRISVHRGEAEPSYSAPLDVEEAGPLAARIASENAAYEALAARRGELEVALTGLAEVAAEREAAMARAADVERLRLAREAILAEAERAMALATTYEQRARRRYATNEEPAAREAARLLASRSRIALRAQAALGETMEEPPALERELESGETLIERRPFEALVAIDRVYRRVLALRGAR
jgi:hypothetical protein